MLSQKVTPEGASTITKDIFRLFALVAAVALSVFPAWSLAISIKKKHQRASKSDWCDDEEDVDGTTTRESRLAYGLQLPHIPMTFLSMIGLVTSIALCTGESRGNKHASPYSNSWINATTWAAASTLASNCLVRYKVAICGSLTSILVLAMTVSNLVRILASAESSLWLKICIVLETVQLTASLALALFYSYIPRRPEVFRESKVVDGRETTSIIGRVWLLWPDSLLRLAAKKDRLQEDDLPEMSYQAQSQTLSRRFEQLEPSVQLWKAVLMSQKRVFALQLAYTILLTLASVVPQVALYSILRALEDRDAGDTSTTRLWVWVACLSISTLMSSWLQAYLSFLCFARIGQPIFQQLAATIFAKSMRRKDIKNNARTRTREDSKLSQAVGATGGDQETCQSTINLVGIDAYRLTSLASDLSVLPGTFLKICLAFIFIVILVGWVPLLVGLIIPIIAIPMNAAAASRYARAQSGLMESRDRKMATITEAFQGIRQIKFSAREPIWQEQILNLREEELKSQWQVFRYETVLVAIWITGPVLLSFMALSAYVLVNKSLTASIAFTTLAVFESLGATLAGTPDLITEYLDGRISTARINAYLRSDERRPELTPGHAIRFRNVSIAWPADGDLTEKDRFRLHDLDFELPHGELTVISGETGSGKSLLLASILGEADTLSGSIEIPRGPPADRRFDAEANASNWYLDGAMAYVAQIPWIQNATLRDNVLFGLPHDTTRFRQTISACALTEDIGSMPDGELTDIGANGINLSGGQKWRVAFARAIYSRATILILDDIFSALDAGVGRHLFENALTGELCRGRTRILVTHHTALCLPDTAFRIVLGDGCTLSTSAGETARTSPQSSVLGRLVMRDTDSQEGTEPNRTIDKATVKRTPSATSSVDSIPSDSSSHVVEHESECSQIISPKQFMTVERQEQGTIQYKLYAEYARVAGGLRHWALVILAFALCIATVLGRSWCVSLWTRAYGHSNIQTWQQIYLLVPQKEITKEAESVKYDIDMWFYLTMFLVWSLAQCALGTIRYFLVFYGSIRASRVFFTSAIHAFFHAPLDWLDRFPIGRILNIFSADFYTLDSRISMDLASLANNVMQIVLILVAGTLVSMWVVVIALLMLLICVHYAWRYLPGAREVKRLNSIAKSKIFTEFGTALVGMATIRAFDKRDFFIDRMHAASDIYAKSYWHIGLFNSWLAMRLNMIGALFVTITGILIVSIGEIDASLAGFALSFTLQFTVMAVWAARQYANVELDMNAVERVVGQSNIQIEMPDGKDVPASWPTEGRIDFKDLCAGYDADTTILKNLNFTVQSHHRIGIIGRTGAGKSTLTLALFRFLEAQAGSIYIDGMDISTIKVSDLRSRLAIIPQDPVLFTGTVRSNLDPYKEHDDNELWNALQRVHWSSASDNRPAHPEGSNDSLEQSTAALSYSVLELRVSEGGLNLSQGQRQLLCLARAMLTSPKILVLDEATSAVDMKTDTLIQRSIREEFRASTLIVIAHRLSTIVDFDMALVMGDGQILEYDQPRVLLHKKAGEFRSMVDASGEKELLEALIM